jgi:hypothetical protein
MRLTKRKNNQVGMQQYKLEKDKYFLQVESSWFEFFKHLTTLSTGVIIIIATLWGNHFLAPRSTPLTQLSFLLLILSLFGSIVGMLVVMPYRSEKNRLKYEASGKKFHSLYENAMAISAGCVSICCFLGGITVFLFNVIL